MVWITFVAILIGLFFLFIPRLITTIHARQRIYSVENTPNNRVAIVFGAGLWRDGRPTTVLRDRVSTAVDLYFSGKVEKVLMSGDNRFENYNEPGAMKAYALELGMPETAILLDSAGTRTYDTCYRALHVFDIHNAVLVTQSFHLPRALYTCNVLGISVTGTSADLHRYRHGSQFYWNLREIPATIIALWQVHVTQPQPDLSTPNPKYPLEAQ